LGRYFMFAKSTSRCRSREGALLILRSPACGRAEYQHGCSPTICHTLAPSPWKGEGWDGGAVLALRHLSTCARSGRCSAYHSSPSKPIPQPGVLEGKEQDMRVLVGKPQGIYRTAPRREHCTPIPTFPLTGGRSKSARLREKPVALPMNDSHLVRWKTSGRCRFEEQP
jgi:hypothetical protein